MGGARIVVVADSEEFVRAGADLVADAIGRDPTATVVAATGRSPMGVYAALAERRRAGLDASRITVVQLDEYLGLAPDDRRSLSGWMRRSFLEPLGVPDDRVMYLPVAGDLEAACPAFDEHVRERGGVDLAILGLGPNGHLGFNEPPSDRRAPTRVVGLARATVEANARYWGGDVADVPTQAVTLGMASLLDARTIVLLASGPEKHGIVRRALEGPVGPQVPASFLQETEATVIVDSAAWGEA